MSTRDLIDAKPYPRRWWHSLAALGIGLVLGLAIGGVFILLSWLLTPPQDRPPLSELVFAKAQQFFLRTDSVQAPTLGSVAPDFALQTLDGETIRLSDLRGKGVVLNFWASWCIPCRREMPELVRVYETHRTEGLEILALNVTAQDSLPAVQAFVEELQLPFPVLLDKTGTVSTDLYQLRGLPTSVFINQEGVMVRIYVGAMTGVQLDQFVAEILP